MKIKLGEVERIDDLDITDSITYRILAPLFDLPFIQTISYVYRSDNVIDITLELKEE